MWRISSLVSSAHVKIYSPLLHSIYICILFLK